MQIASSPLARNLQYFRLSSVLTIKTLSALGSQYLSKEGRTIYRKGTAFAIDKRTLVTAGHNVFYIDSVDDVEIIISPTPCWGENTCGERRVGVLDKIVHPRFENPYPNPPVYDVAVIKTATDLPSSMTFLDIGPVANYR